MKRVLMHIHTQLHSKHHFQGKPGLASIHLITRAIPVKFSDCHLLTCNYLLVLGLSLFAALAERTSLLYFGIKALS